MQAPGQCWVWHVYLCVCPQRASFRPAGSLGPRVSWCPTCPPGPDPSHVFLGSPRAPLLSSVPGTREPSAQQTPTCLTPIQGKGAVTGPQEA